MFDADMFVTHIMFVANTFVGCITFVANMSVARITFVTYYNYYVGRCPRLLQYLYDAGQTFGDVYCKILKNLTLDKKFSKHFAQMPPKLEREVLGTYFCTTAFLPDPNIVLNWRQGQKTIF